VHASLVEELCNWIVKQGIDEPQVKEQFAFHDIDGSLLFDMNAVNQAFSLFLLKLCKMKVGNCAVLQ
jgi:5-methylcytosine-specific restriction endonuclease McrBC regulatory subunit McrC